MSETLQITLSRDVDIISKLLSMITSNPNIVAKDMCDGSLVFKFKQFENSDSGYNETQVYSICKLLKFSKIPKIANIKIDTDSCKIEIPMEFFEFVH